MHRYARTQQNFFTSIQIKENERQKVLNENFGMCENVVHVFHNETHIYITTWVLS